MIEDYIVDLDRPIHRSGGETGRRLERFFKWLITEYVNPSVKSADGSVAHLSQNSPQANQEVSRLATQLFQSVV